MLDRFVQNNIMAEQADRLSAAVLIDYASFLVPVGEPGRLSLTASSHVVTLLNWASSPHLKQMNMAFLLVDEQVAAVSERITGSPHVASIEIPLPDETERKELPWSMRSEAVTQGRLRLSACQTGSTGRSRLHLRPDTILQITTLKAANHSLG